MLNLLNRDEMIASMLSEYKDELAALSDEELHTNWRAMRAMKTASQADWNQLAREMQGEARR